MLRTFGSTVVGLVVLSVVLAPSTVQGQGEAKAYVLDTDAVSSVLGGADVTIGPRQYEDWDASVEYSLTDFDVWVSASVFPSADLAHQRIEESLAQLKTNNEQTDVQPNIDDARSFGADELYDARLVFKDDDGQRVSEYGRLVRIGRAVAIVEALGDAHADDQGVIDSDRALAMMRTFELVIGKLHYYPPDAVQARADMAPFAREWSGHGMSFSVDPTGHGESTWRVYKWCSDDPKPPCDGMTDNEIQSGGRGALVFHRVSDRTAYGTVIGTNDSESLPLGPIKLTVDDQGMAQLSQEGDEPTVLCGPDYLKLAPPQVQSQSPCGA